MPGEALIRVLGTSGDAATASSAGTAPIQAERRGEPRMPTNWIAVIQLRDGAEIPCTVKDVSKSGARLGLPEAVALPDAFVLRVLGYAFRLQVRLVWRSGHCAGVRIERFAKDASPSAEAVRPDPPTGEAEPYTALGRRRSRFSHL